jgi:hypothetical protein
MAESPPKPQIASGRYDSAARRRAARRPRERGCSVYIPAEELVAAGIDPTGPVPFYRVWGRSRGTVLVRLYREG